MVWCIVWWWGQVGSAGQVAGVPEVVRGEGRGGSSTGGLGSVVHQSGRQIELHDFCLSQHCCSSLVSCVAELGETNPVITGPQLARQLSSVQLQFCSRVQTDSVLAWRGPRLSEEKKHPRENVVN